MLADEVNLLIEAENARIVTEANLVRMAVSGILSKKARESFDDLVSALSIKVDPPDAEEVQVDPEEDDGSGPPRLGMDYLKQKGGETKKRLGVDD